MAWYPIFLDLSRKEALVAGAGAVGLRKAASLLAAAPRRLVIVDPDARSEELAERFPDAPLEVRARAFEAEDIAGMSLVFAATGNRAVNAFIAALCAGRGVLCNVIDAPGEGDFIVPAHFRRGDLHLALSTGGHSPALARALRQELEAWVGTRYTPLLAVLGRLRPLLLELDLPSGENSELFRALVHSPLMDRLAAHDRAGAEQALAERLPAPLRARIGELLDGI
jgi:precorrin-2 dehydrogenase/sirohydrochlorin ferrochelatase